MATEATTNVQKAETSNVATAPEQTRTGPVYSPAVDIFENDHSITLLADMPGVKASDLEIDLRENVLTLAGRVTAVGTPKESNVLREYRGGTFFRQFTLAETIDQPKIGDTNVSLQLLHRNRGDRSPGSRGDTAAVGAGDHQLSAGK